PQLPKYPDLSAPGDYQTVVEQYRNDLNRALYKNFQQLNQFINPAPGVDGTSGAAGADGIRIPGATGGGGSGTVTSITATAPITVTPSPLTTTGVISHDVSGVTAATYGDATHVEQVTFDVDGHATSASAVAI